MIELKHSFSRRLLLIFIFLTSLNTHSQEERLSHWQNFKQSLTYAKEDVNFGAGVNISGIYTSKYRKETSMGAGAQFFTGIYLPYSDNMFFHAQLGLGYQQFQHHAFERTINIDMFLLELPLYISAQLPVSNIFETRFLLGWQSNLILGSNQRNDYPEDWSIDGSGIEYSPNNLMRADFGFYFGLGVEYQKWLFKVTGFTGIKKIIAADTGMINTFKLEIGFFPFRKL